MPVVKIGDMTLEAGTDYEVVYADNVNAGTATVTVKGKGNYKGSKNATFEIAAANLESATIKLSQASYNYDGAAKKPYVTVTLDGRTLVEGADYEVGYASNVEVGTAVVAVTGRGNYSGSATTTFAIAPQGKGMVKVIRKGDANAFDTMAAIVDEGKFPTGGTVMVARFDQYYDALCGAALCGRNRSVLVLVADDDALQEAAK